MAHKQTRTCRQQSTVEKWLASAGFSTTGINETVAAAGADGAAAIDNGKIEGFVGATVEFDDGIWTVEIESGYLGRGGIVR